MNTVRVRSKYGKEYVYNYDNDRSSYQGAYHRNYYRSRRKKPIMSESEKKQAHKLAQQRYLKKKANMVTFTDSTIISFGAHKGSKLIDIPASYFLHLRDQKTWDKTTPLGRYIEDNLQVLQSQNKETKRTVKFLKR